MDIQWSSYLKVHYPELALVFPKSSVEEKINISLESRNSSLLKSVPNYQTNFYDLFVRVINMQIGTERERIVSHSLLTLLNDSVKYFIDSFGQDSTLISQLKKQIDGLFRVNGSKYLDKAGELLGTKFLLQNCSNYELLQLEFKYEIDERGKESKDADLLVFDSQYNGRVLIDIFSINLDHEKIENEAGLEKILTERITRKRADKRFDTSLVKTNFKRALIQPFLWVYEIDTLKKYKGFFEAFELENCLPLICLRQRSNDLKEVYFDVTTIQNL